MAVFDSQNSWFKSKIGPIEVGQLQFKIRLEKNKFINNVRLVLCKVGMPGIEKIPMKKLAEENEAIIYIVNCNFKQPATYEYYFEFKKNDKQYYVRRKWFCFEGQVTSEVNNFPWRLTVFEKIIANPKMKTGIMYQIFPDRFYKGKTQSNLPQDRIYRKWGELPYYDQRISSDFFEGNFSGMKEKIGYLNKLHVTILYSNPICYSSKNHRYATKDYKRIDPVLGTEDEFKHFIKVLHENGMLYILDAVFNHVADDSIYLDVYNQHGNGAYSNEASPFREWFFLYGDGKYSCWWNDPSLPKLNYDSESLQNYIFGDDGVLKYWYNKWGIDGIREDVADELTNKEREKMFEISQEERGDNKVVILEVWEDASYKFAYSMYMKYLQGKQATSIMNYPIRDLLLPFIRYGGEWAEKFKIKCNEIFKENYPKEVAYSLMNFISTHDTVRGITKLAGPEIDNHTRQWQAEHNTLTKSEYVLGRRRLLLAYTAIFFFPGIPSIYYGDEIGMQGMADPFCRGCFTWDRIDKKIFRAIKRLCATRYHNQDFLASAEFDILICEEEFLLYERTLDGEKIQVALNFSFTPKDITDIFAVRTIENDNESFVKEPNCIFKIDLKAKNSVVKYNSDGTKRIVLPGLDAIVYKA